MADIKLIKDSDWITPSFDAGDGAVEFVKGFELNKKVVSATLAVTAIGVYDAYLNGDRIGDFVLAPGCTVYNKRLQYQTYDVAALLGGSNTLAITVGKGWHRSRMSESREEINKKPCAVIAGIKIDHADGTSEVIRTDESWQACKTDTVFNDIWDGETCDAAVAAFENYKLEPVRKIGLDKDILIPQEGEIVREQEVLRPIGLITTPKGERVLDFGQEITGYVQFTVNAKKGDRVVLSCAEVFDRDGNFYTGNYRSAKSKMTYICRDGEQTYKPRFTFYGFRYIRLDEYPGEVDPDRFRAVAVYSDMKRSGCIRTSNEKLNRLFSNTLWSQRDNFLDIPTDCPQRDERMGWTGDAQVFAKTACYNYDVKKFFEKWLADVRAEQRRDGSVPDTVPNFWEIPRSSTAWGDVINVIAWRLYRMYGDKGDLEANFDAMKRWVDYMTNDSLDRYLWTYTDDSDLMWRKHYGDWLALDAPSGSYRGITDNDFIASAFYAHSTNLLVKAGKALGKDMGEYEELYENIVKTFKERFKELKTQTAHVLALYFDLTDERAAVAASLDKMIKENGNRLQTGFVGTPYLLYALSENGYVDTAYDLLLQEEYPSWLYEVNHGATTIWEHWDGIKEDGTFWSDDMNSYNHYAYGSVVDWIYSAAGGIRPEKAGFESVVIEPHPTRRIEWLEAEYDSVNGKIVSKWTNTDKGIKYEIKTPVPARIMLNGQVHTVDAGEYEFMSKL